MTEQTTEPIHCVSWWRNFVLVEPGRLPAIIRFGSIRQLQLSKHLRSIGTKCCNFANFRRMRGVWESRLLCDLVQFSHLPHASTTGGYIGFREECQQLVWNHIHDSSYWSLHCGCLSWTLLDACNVLMRIFPGKYDDNKFGQSHVRRTSRKFLYSSFWKMIFDIDVSK